MNVQLSALIASMIIRVCMLKNKFRNNSCICKKPCSFSCCF